MEKRKISVKCDTTEQKQQVIDFARKPTKMDSYKASRATGSYIILFHETSPGIYEGCYDSGNWVKENGHTILSYEEFERNYLKKEEHPIIGEYYTVTDTLYPGRLMIGRVFSIDEHSSDGNIRGEANFITNLSNQGLLRKNEIWCYKDKNNRTFRRSTPEEIEWLNVCIKANKFIPREEASKSKSMKFNIGDKIKFKNGGAGSIPSYGTDCDGIPKDLIHHGRMTFKENKGEIVNTYKDWYIISFTDINDSNVHLGFKENVLEPYIMEEPKLIEGQWYEGVPSGGNKWLFKFSKCTDERPYCHSLAVNTVSKYKANIGWFKEMENVKPANMEEVYKYYPEEKPKPTNLVGRWVKCLEDEAWSSTFKGSYVKKDHYYQLFDIRDNDYYGLEGGNYCGLLRYGEDQEKWKDIGFELMPEGFSPDEAKKTPKLDTEFNIGEEVMYGGKRVTILGFNTSLDQCVIDGWKKGHNGSNSTYWFDKRGHIIPYSPGTNRYYVPVSKLEKIVEKEVIKAGDWVKCIGDSATAAGKHVSCGWKKDLVFKVTETTCNDAILWKGNDGNGVFNVAGHIRKALPHEIPINVVEYSKELIYVTAMDPYDEVGEIQEKKVLVNLIQPKKGGILDTKVNSTYSISESLIKPEKVVLF